MNILDFGCGNGVMLPTLAEHFSSVVAFDIYTKAANQLRMKYGFENIEIRKGQSRWPAYVPFDANRFDVVWASSTLEHIKNLGMAVYQLHRVLKPGGQLLCLSPSEDWLYNLGRKLFRLHKPADHYHTGKEIHEALQEYFTCEAKKSWPPLTGTYLMGRYRK